MRTLFISLLVAALALTGCAPAPQSARPETGEPAIWRIADADSEIWLFGSVHMLPPHLSWRGERLEAALSQAEELWTETDTGPAAEAAFPALMRRYAGLPPGETLSTLAGETEARRVRDAAAALGLPAAAVENQRPWFTALQLSTLSAARAGHRPDAGVEAVIAAEARARGLRLAFFETPEQQVRVLADLDRADELRLLAATLDDLDGGDGALDALDRAWARGDTQELARLLDAQWRRAGPGVHEAVILRRNRAWAQAIEARLSGAGRSLVVVGAAHLVGDGSVVALLRQRGVEVEGP